MKPSSRGKDPFAGIRQGQLGFSLALGFAMDLALWIVAGVWADRHFGTRPLWTVVGVFVGIGTAVSLMIAMSRTMTRSGSTDDPEKPEP